jgi:hypothetical protein
MRGNRNLLENRIGGVSYGIGRMEQLFSFYKGSYPIMGIFDDWLGCQPKSKDKEQPSMKTREEERQPKNRL